MEMTNSKVENIEEELSNSSGPCIETMEGMENIKIPRKIPDQKISKTCGNIVGKKIEKIDSDRSRESLFKTFTFEQTRGIDDPETIKCINFWKNVMKKNLAPIKCTLLQNDKKSSGKNRMNPHSSKTKCKKINKAENETNELNFSGDGAKIWAEALKEIRKKKLNQLRLYMRERCQYCTDPFTKELDKMGIEGEDEQRSIILSLNEWKPKPDQTDLTNNFASRNYVKMKKVSTSPIEETRMEKELTDKYEKGDPNQQSPIKTVLGDPTCSEKEDYPKRHSSILKNPQGHVNQKSSILNGSSKKVVVPRTSVDVQAPNIKCPCESDTCLCPHKAAARNSRTSFVQIARNYMLRQDESTEKIFSEDGETCICVDHKPQPWNKLTCVNEPCPAKQPRVTLQESSSDLELHRRMIDAKGTKETCVCTKNLDVLCPSMTCKLKSSQGSLIEGYPQAKDDKTDGCICGASDAESPCTSERCPIKVANEIPKTCVCGSNSPWSQANCSSWNCPYHRNMKVKKIDTDVQLVFKGHPPLREVTSTCVCGEKTSKNVTCRSDFCKLKVEPDAKVKNASHLKTTMKSNKKEIAETAASASNDNSEKMNKIKHTGPPPEESCLCSVASPWKIVTCSKNCSFKNKETKQDLESSVGMKCQSLLRDEECICGDANVESTCKSNKCKNKISQCQYSIPCLCLANNTTQRCVYESCKMKQIDETCLCELQSETHCDAKTCKLKPPASKTLTQSKKPLIYDSKCICRLRGLPISQDVACTAPVCPFKIKQTEKKSPMILKPPPTEYKPEIDQHLNKCLCNAHDPSVMVNCRSTACKKKTTAEQSDATMNDCEEDNLKQKICICKTEKSEFDEDHDVICHTVQCPTTYTRKNEISINDKCVCVNLDQICSEPTCPSAGYEQKNNIRNEVLQKKKEKYCYICGNKHCSSDEKQKEVCNEIFT